MIKILLLFSFLTYSLVAGDVKLLYDTDNEGKMDKANQWIVQMIEEAGRIKNINVHFEGVTWSRGLDLVRQGVADGIINASYKTDRAEYALYPMKDGKLDAEKSIKAPAYMLYVLKNSNIDFDGKSIRNLKGKVGAIESYAVVEDLKNLGVEIKYGQNELANLKSLLHNEIDASVGSESAVDPMIAKDTELKNNIKKLTIPVRKKEYYLIFSKPYYANQKSDAEAIWEGIKELKNTQKYQKLLQDYP